MLVGANAHRSKSAGKDLTTVPVTNEIAGACSHRASRSCEASERRHRSRGTTLS